MSAKKSWEKRVTKFDTWFDRRRMRMRAEFNGKDFKDIQPVYDSLLRNRAIIGGYISWTYTQTGTRLHTEDFIHKSNYFIEGLNLQLPIRLPNGRSMIDSVYQLVDEQKEYITFVMENRAAVNEVLDAEMKSKMYILDFVDAATCGLHSMLLSSPNTELMVLDADLADKVLLSENTSLTAEDLTCCPFDQCFLEFNRPVVAAEYNGKQIKSIGVGFYKNYTRNCYSVLWFRDLKDFNMTGEPIVDSMLSVTFSPPSKLQRIIIDDISKAELGFPHIKHGSYLGGNFFGRGSTDTMLDDFNRAFHETQDSLLLKTRNIWDFVTSRNIDYEIVERGTKDLSGLRRYQHIQGKMHVGPRMFKVLKVNKRVERSETSNIGQGNATILGYKEHVPGSFHKWIYCRACERTHRHDLIGKPCRRCGQIVGPVANIEIKKWWHEDYWRGEGELKEVVREIRE